jgi:hypothetical protein
MAKIILQQAFAEISGKLNGTVFAKNRGGAYMRTKVSPVNARTAAQLQARNLLSGYSQAWRNLTQTQRDSWNAASSDWSLATVFAQGATATGHGLFVTLNTNTNLAGGSSLTLPPNKVGAVPVQEFNGVTAVVGGAITLDMLPANVPADHTLYIESTQGMSAGISNANSKYRFIGTLADGDATDVDLVTFYESKFGALTAGQKIFFRVKFINKITGEVSLPVTASTIVTD